MSTSEDSSSLTSLRLANSPNSLDLRRIGAHPDYWYPGGLVRRAQSRQGAGAAFRGRAHRHLSRVERAGVRVWRTAARTARCRCTSAWSAGMKSSATITAGLTAAAANARAFRTSGKERLPNGVKSYPAREVDGLIFVFPGDPALAESRLPQRLGASQRKDYKTRRLNREVACHYTFMHENLFDMNHQFMHRKQMGSIRANCLGRKHGEDWAQVEYSFSRTGGKQSMGEQVIVDLMRKRSEAKKDFSDHMRIRTDYPTQSLKVWVGRNIQETDDPVLEVWLGYTPLDAEQRTNRTYGYLSVKKPKVAVVIHAVWPFVVWFTENIFREDKEIVEYEQRAYDSQGADWNNEVFPAIRDLRGVLARCGKPMD